MGNLMGAVGPRCGAGAKPREERSGSLGEGDPAERPSRGDQQFAYGPRPFSSMTMTFRKPRVSIAASTQAVCGSAIVAGGTIRVFDYSARNPILTAPYLFPFTKKGTARSQTVSPVSLAWV